MSEARTFRGPLVGIGAHRLLVVVPPTAFADDVGRLNRDGGQS